MCLSSIFKKNGVNIIHDGLSERQKEIYLILNKAASVDKNLQLFGAGKHKYSLNKPIDISYVRKAEQAYNFTLPEDYFKFIIEIGDGGAGPDYGIYPFTSFYEKGNGEYAKEYFEQRRQCLAVSFNVRPMVTEDVNRYAICREDSYEEEPGKYFVCDENDDNSDRKTDSSENGFFILGTHGCQWDFGIVVTGNRKGQVFRCDNEGGFYLLANSFIEFYDKWLDKISNMKKWKKPLGKTGIFQI